MANNSHPDIALISEHDTWISIDPFLGCPANCTYCYLRPLGLTSQKPQARVTPGEVITSLVERFGKRGPSWGGQASLPLPICIGNYTDQLMTVEGIEFLKAYFPLHAEHFPSHPLCVVTKAKLCEQDIIELDSVGHPLLVFLSQSFIHNGKQWEDIERGPISKPEDTFANAILLAKSKNLIPIHFWRPLSEQTIPDIGTAMCNIERLKESGVRTSVAIGLKCGPTLRFQTNQFAGLFGDTELPEIGQYLPKVLEERVLEAGRQLDYPVYRQTSCAVAYVTGMHESLGTWRSSMRSSLCEPCSCPSNQRGYCNVARLNDVEPQEEILLRMTQDLELPRKAVSWNSNLQEIDVNAVISQSVHAKWTHLTGFPVRALEIRPTLAWKGELAREGSASKDV